MSGARGGQEKAVKGAHCNPINPLAQPSHGAPDVPSVADPADPIEDIRTCRNGVEATILYTIGLPEDKKLGRCVNCV